MNSVVKNFLLAFAGVAMAFTSVAAQDAQPPVQGRAAARVEQYKKIRMMEVLGMDEQTSIRFFLRYDKNLEVMKGLRQKQVQALTRVQSLRKDKAPDNDYAKVISDLRSLEEQINRTKSKYIDDLKEVLTNQQLAEYLVFELRFQQNLRDLIRDMQQKNKQEPQKL
jgi:hypothetical protein